jgi:uncharacterized protein with beta-barrel porin domain
MACISHNGALNNFEENEDSGGLCRFHNSRLESGYRLPFGIVAATPYGALQMQELFLPAHCEFATSGSPQFALSYTSRTFTATRTEIGA